MGALKRQVPQTLVRFRSAIFGAPLVLEWDIKIIVIGTFAIVRFTQALRSLAVINIGPTTRPQIIDRAGALRLDMNQPIGPQLF